MGPSDKQQKAQEILDKLPEEARKKLVMDNEGNLVANNRARRRQKPPTDNWETKNTHSYKLKRDAIREKAPALKRKQKREEAKHNR